MSLWSLGFDELGLFKPEISIFITFWDNRKNILYIFLPNVYSIIFYTCYNIVVVSFCAISRHADI